MGLVALGVYLFPFMKHVDEKIEPEDLRESTQSKTEQIQSILNHKCETYGWRGYGKSSVRPEYQ